MDNLIDAVGAGDALLAYSTLAMLVSKMISTQVFWVLWLPHVNVNVMEMNQSLRARCIKIDAVERRVNFD